MFWNVSLKVPSDFGLEVARIVAVIAIESFQLNVNNFLMFGEVLNEDTASRALLSLLRNSIC